MIFRLLAFVLPLGLDTFVTATAIGSSVRSARDRWRVTFLAVLFEGGMPAVGLLLGTPLAHLAGGAADFISGLVLIGIGTWAILEIEDDDDDDDDEDEKAKGLVFAKGKAVIALALSISLDELAVGFGLGLAHVPILLLVSMIAIQAFIVVQLGLWIGRSVLEDAERVAGLVIAGLGVFQVVYPMTV